MKLYEIAEEMRTLLDSMDEYIDEETGEVAPEFGIALNGLDKCAHEIIEGIGVRGLELKGDIETVEKELKRLKGRKESMQGSIVWLKNYATDNMKSLGLGKHTSPGKLFTVWLQKGPDSIHIERPGALPTVFQRITVEPAKKLIKEAWDAGQLEDEIIGLAGIELITGAKKVRYK